MSKIRFLEPSVTCQVFHRVCSRIVCNWPSWRMDPLVKPLVYASCAGSSVLCFLFLLTDSWGNLTAFSTSCSIAATPFPTRRAANFSPVTLRKIPFPGKWWHVSPAYMYPIYPCSPLLNELFSVMFHVSGMRIRVCCYWSISDRTRFQNSALPFTLT